MNYVWHLLIMIGIYTILGSSLNLLVGYTGILSFVHGLMYGIGAYALAIFVKKLGFGFAPAMFAGFAVTFVVGFLMMRVLHNLKGDYLILAFFGMQLGGIGIIHNWVSVTDGPFGIYNIPKPSLGPFAASGYIEFLVVVWAIVALAYFISFRLVNSQFGIILKSIREDEIASSALGRNVTNYRCVIFGVGSGIASLAGALYASYSSYIHPSNFGLDFRCSFLR